MKKLFVKSVSLVILTALLSIIPHFPAQGAEPGAGERRYRGDLFVYLAFEGDLKESGDHGMKFLSPDDPGNNPDILAHTETIRSGYTTTVSIEFPVAVSHVYLIAPVVVAADDSPLTMVDAKVSLTVDGMTYFTDYSAGEIRKSTPLGQYQNSYLLSGGVGEGGETFIDTAVLTGASKIEYTVTLSSVFEPVPDENAEIADTQAPDGNDDVMQTSPEGDNGTETANGATAGSSAMADPSAQPAGDIVIESDKKKIDAGGLAAGIIVAAIALIMIAGGVFLSRRNDAGEND